MTSFGDKMPVRISHAKVPHGVVTVKAGKKNFAGRADSLRTATRCVYYLKYVNIEWRSGGKKRV